MKPTITTTEIEVSAVPAVPATRVPGFVLTLSRDDLERLRDLLGDTDDDPDYLHDAVCEALGC